MLFFQELGFKGGQSTADEILAANRLTTNFFSCSRSPFKFPFGNETSLLSLRRDIPTHKLQQRVFSGCRSHCLQCWVISGTFWKPSFHPRCSIPPSFIASWARYSIPDHESHSGERQVSIHLCEATNSRAVWGTITRWTWQAVGLKWPPVRDWASEQVLLSGRDLAGSPRKCYFHSI